jgi:hypothetical protein
MTALLALLLVSADPVTAATVAEPAAPPAATAPAEKPAEKPAEAKKTPATVVSGRVFADVTKKRGFEGGNGFGFDLKRFYIGVTHTLDEHWSAQFISDIGDRHATDVKTDPKTGKLAVTLGRYDIFVKKAWLEYAAAKPAVFRLGASDMPWVPYVEALYGYRYVENLLVDRVKFGTTTDWGLHAFGQASVLKYAVSAVNGGTFTNPSRSKAQDPDVEGRLAVEPGLGLAFALGGYYGTLSPPTLHVLRPATRLDGFAGFTHERFRMGYEYFVANNWKTVASGKPDRARGYSAWASVLVVDPVSLFARIDHTRMSERLKAGDVEDYLLTGVEYKVSKAIALAAAYKNIERLKVSSHEYGVWTDFKF